jgi:hypothetical protein
MMNKRKMKNLYPLLKIISKLTDEERRVLLQYLNHEGCEGIYECVDNALCNKSLPDEQRQDLASKLSEEKKLYRFIVDENKNSLKKQKKLVQVGGSLGTVLQVVLPLLSQFIANKIKKE